MLLAHLLKQFLNCHRVIFFHPHPSVQAGRQHSSLPQPPAPCLRVKGGKNSSVSPRNAILFVIRQTADGVHCGFIGGEISINYEQICVCACVVPAIANPPSGKVALAKSLNGNSSK